MSLLKYIVAAISVIILVIAGTIMMDRILIPNIAYTDTLPRHTGCTSFWQGESPYSEASTLRTQQIIQENYDSSYDPVDDQHRFAYPAHMCIILLPLWVVSYDIAAPLWMFLNFMMFVVLPVIFLLKATQYHVPLWQSMLLIIFSIFLWRYSMITVIFAQYTGWVLFCLVGAMWALINRLDTALALFLVGIIIRTGGAFFAIVILIYMVFDRRYRSLLIFGALMLILWIISLVMIGPWVFDFLQGLFTYTTYREDVSVFLPFKLGILAGSIYTIMMLGTAFLVLRSAWKQNRETFIVWGLATLPLIELILLPQTNDYTLVYALPAIFLVAYAFRNKVLEFIVLYLGISIVPWVWSLWLGPLIPGRYDQLFMPAFVLLMVAYAWWRGEVQIEMPSDDTNTAPTSEEIIE